MIANGQSARHVLVVEDDSVQRLVVQRKLESRGLRVQVARDGLDGWNAFCAAREGDSFDLIISDVEMPRLSGLEFLARVRSVDHDVPVLILTGHQDRATLLSALQLQVGGFIDKRASDEEFTTLTGELISVGTERRAARELHEEMRRIGDQAVSVSERSRGTLAVRSASRAAAGGDAFHCWTIDHDRDLFILADVSGHSVASSYATAAFIGAAATYLDEVESLSRFLARINSHLAMHRASLHGNYVCVLVGINDYAAGTVRLAAAGTPLPCLYRPGMAPLVVGISGPPLGLFPDGDWGEELVSLLPDTCVLGSSDGLPDTRNETGAHFESVLPEIVQPLVERGADVDVIADDLMASVARWQGGRQEDDRTFFVLTGKCGSQVFPEQIMTLPSSFVAIAEATTNFRTFLERHRVTLGRRDLRDAVSAVREALMNAISHGNRFAPDRQATMTIRLEPAAVVVRVEDEGSGVALPPGESDSPDALETGGRGFILMKSLSDRLETMDRAVSLTFLRDPAGDRPGESARHKESCQ